jgi:NADH:ubiquinone reductase (H+-translocating)
VVSGTPGALPRQGSAQRPEVLVIGGGFAGLEVVRVLAGEAVHVTIVDKHNFHTFLPLLYQVATAGLEPADVAYPIRTIFGRSGNVAFRHGLVTHVDLDERTARLNGGAQLAFDHVVFASGAVANFFGIPGADEYAKPLYTLADARHLRDQLLLSLEGAESDVDARPVTFVIVGGGPTGVETAGAVLELLEVCLEKDHMQIDRASTKVILLDVSSRLLGGFSKQASDYARRTLERRGVEVRLGQSVAEVTTDAVRLSSGESIATRLVVWAAGVTAAGTIVNGVGPDPGSSGRVLVERDLSVTGRRGVWAVGDSVAVPTGQGDAICPQLAQVAIQSGRHCGRQILNVIEGEPTSPFRYEDKGIMATIGRNAAVAQLPRGPLITGFLGWIAWMSLHLFYLVGFRNRLRVFINWTWRYFDWPSGPRLIMADAESAE